MLGDMTTKMALRLIIGAAVCQLPNVESRLVRTILDLVFLVLVSVASVLIGTILSTISLNGVE